MSKFTKILVSAIAVTAMVAGVGGMIASANTSTRATPISVTWHTNTSGSTTTYTAEIYTGMVGGLVRCTDANYIETVYAHPSNYTWTAQAENVSSSSRNMTASTQIYDVINSTWVFSAADNETSDCTTGGMVYASSTYSSLPRRYYYLYTAYIRGGTTSYPPIIEDVDFYERYVG